MPSGSSSRSRLAGLAAVARRERERRDLLRQAADDRARRGQRPRPGHERRRRDLHRQGQRHGRRRQRQGLRLQRRRQRHRRHRQRRRQDRRRRGQRRAARLQRRRQDPRRRRQRLPRRPPRRGRRQPDRRRRRRRAARRREASTAATATTGSTATATRTTRRPTRSSAATATTRSSATSAATPGDEIDAGDGDDSVAGADEDDEIRGGDGDDEHRRRRRATTSSSARPATTCSRAATASTSSTAASAPTPAPTPTRSHRDRLRDLGEPMRVRSTPLDAGEQALQLDPVERALAQDRPVAAVVDLAQVDDGRGLAAELAAVDREVGAGEDLRVDLLEAGRGRGAAAVRRGLEDGDPGARERARRSAARRAARGRRGWRAGSGAPGLAITSVTGPGRRIPAASPVRGPMPPSSSRIDERREVHDRRRLAVVAPLELVDPLDRRLVQRVAGEPVEAVGGEEGDAAVADDPLERLPRRLGAISARSPRSEPSAVTP